MFSSQSQINSLLTEPEGLSLSTQILVIVFGHKIGVQCNEVDQAKSTYLKHPSVFIC